MDLNDPVTVALLADEALERAGIGHGLYGGLLLAAYGEPRETKDADLAILEGDAKSLVDALSAAGAVSARATFDHVQFGGLSISRVTVLGGAESTGLNTISLVAPRNRAYGERLLSRCAIVPFGGHDLSVVSIEDFVVLKVLSTRDKDLDDAASVLRRSGDVIDEELIVRECGTLAAALPDLPIAHRWAEIRSRATRTP